MPDLSIKNARDWIAENPKATSVNINAYAAALDEIDRLRALEPDLGSAVLAIITSSKSLELSVVDGHWRIYKLEDGRVAISKFDDAGKQLIEELYSPDAAERAAQAFASMENDGDSTDSNGPESLGITTPVSIGGSWPEPQDD